MMYNIDDLLKAIDTRLNSQRAFHSFCVALRAGNLADKYGADRQKAEIAGILHDATKQTPIDQQLELIEKAGLELTELERSNPKFYHQISGCAFAKTEMGIDDEEILGAIRYHTTGKADMTLLQQIIYLADFISDDRNYYDISVIRKETEKGIGYGLLYATKYTIVKNIRANNLLHPDTVDAYNWTLKTYFAKEKER